MAAASESMRQPRVLLVEDHELFRAGLRRLLEKHGFTIVGESADGEAAVHIAARADPDIVIMDLALPDISGVAAIRPITQASSARVLVLTVSPDQGDIAAAIQAGASGYLIKDAEPQEIVAAIRTVLTGGSALSPRVAAKLLARLRKERSLPDAELPHLTERELEVLRLLTAGKNNPEIAEELFVSVSTVKSHVSTILGKLGVHNRTEATAYAVGKGLI
jgi:DNA-binding NarL/FixJ family response regulator